MLRVSDPRANRARCDQRRRWRVRLRLFLVSSHLSKGERVWNTEFVEIDCALHCIVGMRSFGAVDQRSLSDLLHCFPLKSFTILVLRIPDSLWLSVLESNHVVFPSHSSASQPEMLALGRKYLPVSQVITNFMAHYNGACIQSIEIHVKCINDIVFFFHDSDSATGRVLCL
jgi:hypothetical protein